MGKVLISACLMGENVRFDGKNSHKRSEIIAKWQECEVLVVLCPEVTGGLSVPRLPAEIQPDGRIINIEKEDVTDAFEKGAQKALALCKENNIHVAILKEGSPSCGSLCINNGAFDRTKIPGQGMTTQLLEANGIRVFSEERVEEAEVFLNRLEE
jgi:uncharacterized protein YbbK (DUF523 family)